MITGAKVLHTGELQYTVVSATTQLQGSHAPSHYDMSEENQQHHLSARRWRRQQEPRELEKRKRKIATSKDCANTTATTILQCRLLTVQTMAVQTDFALRAAHAMLHKQQKK